MVLKFVTGSECEPPLGFGLPPSTTFQKKASFLPTASISTVLVDSHNHEKTERSLTLEQHLHNVGLDHFLPSFKEEGYEFYASLTDQILIEAVMFEQVQWIR